MKKVGIWRFKKRHAVQAFCYSTMENLDVTICSSSDFGEGLKDGRIKD
jgi:hypothetical protein